MLTFITIHALIILKAVALFLMPFCLYHFTMRVLDMILKLHKGSGTVSFRPFAWCMVGFFVSGYVLYNV